MRLLIATPLYPPEPGGPATHTRLLEERLHARGIDVQVVKFASVRKYPPGIRHALFLIALVREARHADALLVQDTVSCGVPAALAALLTRKPLVARVPGDYAWEQGRQRFGVVDDLDTFQTRHYGWRVGLMRALQSWVVGRAALIIVPSKYFAGIVSQWGASPERIAVIYHGMDSVTPRMPEQVLESPFMVSVGRLVPWKGFACLIRILRDLPDWRLVIVGDGPDRELLECVARNVDVESRVIFTGAVPRDEVLGWCAAADAFVLNTSFESFSFQVLEALSVGSRIITTHIGSIPELITDGQEGVLLSPNDAKGLVEALTSVRKEGSVWESRQEAARLRAREFSTERMIDRTVSYLERL